MSRQPNQHQRRRLRQWKREQWTKQKGRCAYCNAIFRDRFDSTIDHLIPKSRGGTHARSNLRLVCRACNQAKGNLLPGDPGWSAA